MSKKKALITGITGQDGSYLSEFLIKKGYEVHGTIRRSSTFSTERIQHLYQDPHEATNLFLHYSDLTDASSTNRLLRTIRPDEIYNLAAQSHVRVSFDKPEYTIDTIVKGTLILLEALRDAEFKTRFYQASSSEMYGEALEIPQDEDTPLNPQSPYAVAKVAAHELTQIYRDGYGIFACSGILFNHESPKRGETFVSKKITRALARIVTGKQDKLYLGNLKAKRDWGYAPDYVEAMWLMLQQKEPDDYVIATGETHTVEDFLDEAFGLVGLSWKRYVKIDPQYYRPLEVNILQGDASKARKKLGWKPKIKFQDLVRLMVINDLEEEGYDISPLRAKSAK